MVEYIEREAVLEIIRRTSGDYAAAFAEVRKLSAADVVEVVRCKDCKWNKPDKLLNALWCTRFSVWSQTLSNSFCNYGERREND